MAQTEYRITEIVCLRSKVLKTGRPRVMKITDMEGEQWEKLVAMAESYPKNFEVHRETLVSEEEQGIDFEAIPLKVMLGMAREKVAEIAVYYGIRDEGQKRNILIDQIAAEREATAKLKRDRVIEDQK
jgi:hypothetical protein